MATAIPTYQRQVLNTGVQSSPQAQNRTPSVDPVNQALGNVGDNLQKVAFEGLNEERKQIENEQAVNVVNTLSNSQIGFQQDFTERTQAWKPGDPDLRDGISQSYDKWISEAAPKFTTDASRKYFQQHAIGMKTEAIKNAFTFQQKATTQKLNADFEAGQQADENFVYNNPQAVDDVFNRRWEAMIHRTDLSEADKVSLADKSRRSLYKASENGELSRDPAGWYERRFGKFTPLPGGTVAQSAPGQPAPIGGGFDSVIGQILKTEGGYNASDGNTGNPVNFGINQKANPDIDVKSLTKEGATKLYKDRYWDVIGGDSLPPAIQGTAMDAAVNQGPGNAKKWLAESGGDPVKFNALRRAQYEELLKQPKYAANRESWMNRLDAYDKAAAAAPMPTIEVTAKAEPAAPVVPPKSFQGLDWEQQLALKNLAVTKIKQGEAVFKADTDRIVRDATAMHTDGKVDPFNLTQDTFTRAYGVDGARQYGEYLKSREMGASIGSFASKSETEIKTDLALARPGGGPGYADADARFNTQTKAAQAVLEQRKVDPAGTVLKNTPSLTQQFASIQTLPPGDPGRPVAMQRFATGMIAEQTRLGIQSPVILPKQMAESIVMDFNKATGNGDNMATRIAQGAKDWGPAWPAVYAQLATNFKGDLPDSFLVIPGIQSAAARETVARLDHIKLADLKNQVSAPDAKSIDQGIQTALKPFSESMLQNKTNTDLYQAIYNSATKIALESNTRGIGVDAAVKRATDTFIGQYDFVNSHSAQKYAIPKSENSALVQQGVARVMADLPNADIGAPPFGDVTGLRKPEELAKEWKSQVSSNPIWVTNADETGLKLYAEGKDGQRYPVNATNGKQVEYKFRQLRDLASERKATMKVRLDDQAASPAAMRENAANLMGLP